MKAPAAAALSAELAVVHDDAFRWALACCAHDRAEAEDVLQQSYLKILEGRARFGGRSTFRTWLFGVIRLTALARRRTAWLRRVLPFVDDDDAGASSAPAPDDQAAAAEDRARVRTALRALSPRQREVIELVFTLGCTVEEAAQVLGISIGSARTHYARGKAAVAAALTDDDARAPARAPAAPTEAGGTHAR